MARRKYTRLNNKPKGDYRSRYEFDIATNLERRNITFEYEMRTVPYQVSEKDLECTNCGSSDVVATRYYTPDFILPHNGIVIEGKGLFTRRDRDKTIAVLASNNSINRDNFRLLFMRNDKLSKKSTKRYLDWAEEHDIIADIGPEVPEAWLLVENLKSG